MPEIFFETQCTNELFNDNRMNILRQMFDNW